MLLPCEWGRMAEGKRKRRKGDRKERWSRNVGGCNGGDKWEGRMEG